MSKHHDEDWAEEMFREKPPAGYAPTLLEAVTLADMGDQMKAVSAAYNYGFIRGRRYEKAHARKMRKGGGHTG